jgi:hypothetical protein
MRRPFLLTLLLLASYAYFYEGGGWNQNTRFDLVRAIVEQGTIRIDDFHQNTGDKAVANGHYYADKAPGASWFAAPFVAAARRLLHAAGFSTESTGALTWLSYLATLTASAVPATIAALCVFALARRFGASPDGAAIAALAYGLSTPLWAYGTLFFGHALAAACLLGACLAADRLRDPGFGDRRVAWLSGLTGALGGCAVVTEYPSVIGAAVLAGLALVYASRGGRSQLFLAAGALCVGAGVGALALGLYFNAAFGSPFHVSYASEENSALLRAGFFGITLPSPVVIAELLWGSKRGLLLLSPALIVTLAEFGRTPAINSSLGRDHFASAWSVTLTGCGVRNSCANRLTRSSSSSQRNWSRRASARTSAGHCADSATATSTRRAPARSSW